MANKPARTIKAGNVRINVWVNKGEKFDSVSYQIVKNYKVGDEWKTTNSFTLAELADVRDVIQQIRLTDRIKTESDF